MKIKGHKRSTASFRITVLRKLLLLVFVVGGLQTGLKAQNVQVEARLDRVTIPIGEQTVLHLSAKMPAKTVIAFPQLADSIGKVQIVKSLKADTVADKNDATIQTVSHNYLITAFDEGVYTLPEFTFHTQNGELQTATVTLQVKTIRVDTTKAFYDIKQPLTVSYNLWDWIKDHWKALLLALVIILLIAGLIYYYKKRPKTVHLVKTEPALPADVLALNKLNALRDKKLWQQNEIKLYYSELTDVLREYLENSYQIKAHEQTTDEIFAALNDKGIPKSSKTQLHQLLTRADLVKFAKAKPAALENEQSLDNAVDFVMQTKPQATVQKEELPE